MREAGIFKTEEYDFGKLLCGKLDYKDKLFVIYRVPRKIGKALKSQKE